MEQGQKQKAIIENISCFNGGIQKVLYGYSTKLPEEDEEKQRERGRAET